MHRQGQLVWPCWSGVPAQYCNIYFRISMLGRGQGHSIDVPAITRDVGYDDTTCTRTRLPGMAVQYAIAKDNFDYNTYLLMNALCWFSCLHNPRANNGPVDRYVRRTRQHANAPIIEISTPCLQYRCGAISPSNPHGIHVLYISEII